MALNGIPNWQWVRCTYKPRRQTTATIPKFILFNMHSSTGTKEYTHRFTTAVWNWRAHLPLKACARKNKEKKSNDETGLLESISIWFNWMNGWYAGVMGFDDTLSKEHVEKNHLQILRFYFSLWSSLSLVSNHHIVRFGYMTWVARTDPSSK